MLYLIHILTGGINMEQYLKLATDQRPFFMIYQDCLDSDKLESVYELALFVALKSFANKNNQCFPSVSTLAKKSRMSRVQASNTLQKMINKGIIISEATYRADGGRSSNIYTLYDYKKTWASEEPEKEIKENEIKENEMVRILLEKGYKITKEDERKEPNTSLAPTKVNDVESPLKKTSLDFDNKANEAKSQEVKEKKINKSKKNTEPRGKAKVSEEKVCATETYSMDYIKETHGYDYLIRAANKNEDDVNTIMHILYDIYNTGKRTVKVNGVDKPKETVVGRLKKLDVFDIIYVIEEYHKQTVRIKHPISYITTMLYNAHEQQHLDVTNQVMHDMYGQDKTPTEAPESVPKPTETEKLEDFEQKILMQQMQEMQEKQEEIIIDNKIETNSIKEPTNNNDCVKRRFYEIPENDTESS